MPVPGTAEMSTGCTLGGWLSVSILLPFSNSREGLEHDAERACCSVVRTSSSSSSSTYSLLARHQSLGWTGKAEYLIRRPPAFKYPTSTVGARRQSMYPSSLTLTTSARMAVCGMTACCLFAANLCTSSVAQQQHKIVHRERAA